MRFDGEALEISALFVTVNAIRHIFKELCVLGFELFYKYNSGFICRIQRRGVMNAEISPPWILTDGKWRTFCMT